MNNNYKIRVHGLANIAGRQLDPRMALLRFGALVAQATATERTAVTIKFDEKISTIVDQLNYHMHCIIIKGLTSRVDAEIISNQTSDSQAVPTMQAAHHAILPYFYSNGRVSFVGKNPWGGSFNAGFNNKQITEIGEQLVSEKLEDNSLAIFYLVEPILENNDKVGLVAKAIMNGEIVSLPTLRLNNGCYIALKISKDGLNTAAHEFIKKFNHPITRPVTGDIRNLFKYLHYGGEKFPNGAIIKDIDGAFVSIEGTKLRVINSPYHHFSEKTNAITQIGSKYSFSRGECNGNIKEIIVADNNGNECETKDLDGIFFNFVKQPATVVEFSVMLNPRTYEFEITKKTHDSFTVEGVTYGYLEEEIKPTLSTIQDIVTITAQSRPSSVCDDSTSNADSDHVDMDDEYGFEAPVENTLQKTEYSIDEFKDEYGYLAKIEKIQSSELNNIHPTFHKKIDEEITLLIPGTDQGNSLAKTNYFDVFIKNKKLAYLICGFTRLPELIEILKRNSTAELYRNVMYHNSAMMNCLPLDVRDVDYATFGEIDHWKYAEYGNFHNMLQNDSREQIYKVLVKSGINLMPLISWVYDIFGDSKNLSFVGNGSGAIDYLSHAPTDINTYSDITAYSGCKRNGLRIGIEISTVQDVRNIVTKISELFEGYADTNFIPLGNPCIIKVQQGITQLTSKHLMKTVVNERRKAAAERGDEIYANKKIPISVVKPTDIQEKYVEHMKYMTAIIKSQRCIEAENSFAKLLLEATNGSLSIEFPIEEAELTNIYKQVKSSKRSRIDTMFDTTYDRLRKIIRICKLYESVANELPGTKTNPRDVQIAISRKDTTEFWSLVPEVGSKIAPIVTFWDVNTGKRIYVSGDSPIPEFDYKSTAFSITVSNRIASPTSLLVRQMFKHIIINDIEYNLDNPGIQTFRESITTEEYSIPARTIAPETNAAAIRIDITSRENIAEYGRNRNDFHGRNNCISFSEYKLSVNTLGSKYLLRTKVQLELLNRKSAWACYVFLNSSSRNPSKCNECKFFDFCKAMAQQNGKVLQEDRRLATS